MKWRIELLDCVFGSLRYTLRIHGLRNWCAYKIVFEKFAGRRVHMRTTIWFALGELCSSGYILVESFIKRPLTYQLTYVLTCLLSYLPTYVLTCLLTYLPTCLLTYLHTYLHTYLPAYLLTYLPTYLLACLPTYFLEQSPS